MKNVRGLIVALCFTAGTSGYLLAETVHVGTCSSLKAQTTFTTIQEAVNHSPIGTTILVCPGVYPEQLVIDKALTIKGISSGTSGGAIIASPPGGVVANAISLSSGNPIAAQVVVTETTNVNLSNLTIDGSNNNIDGCRPALVGLFYRNASGELSHLVVMNQVVTSVNVLCATGLGIYAQSGNGETTTVSIKDSHIQNYQKNGITANEPGTSVNIEGNNVIGRGNMGEAESSIQNSIQIGYGANAKIVENIVMDDIYGPTAVNNSGEGAVGILVFASPGVVVAGNTVGNTQFGIAIVSDDTFGPADGGTIISNKVTATRNYDGIDICSSSNRVQHNVIYGSNEAGIHVDGNPNCEEVTGNQVTNNTISGGCAGILVGPATEANVSDNIFFNARNTVLAGDACPAPQQSLLHANAAVLGGGSKSKSQPARP